MSKKKTTSKKLFTRKIFLISILSLVAISLICITLFIYLFLNRIFPGIYISNVNVSALTSNQAEQKIIQEIKNRQVTTLTFKSSSNQTFKIKLNTAVSNYNLEEPINQSLEYGHKKVYFKKINLTTSPSLSPNIKNQIEEIASSVDVLPIDSQLTVNDGEITVTPSQDGQILDQDSLEQTVLNYLNTGKLTDNTLPTQKAYPKLSYQTALTIKQRLDQIKLEPLKLTFKGQTFLWDISTVLELIDLKNAKTTLASGKFGDQKFNLSSVSVGKKQIVDTNITLDKKQLNLRLKDIAYQIDRPVEEPLFQFDPNTPTKITQFQPPQEGQELNISEAENKVTQALLASNQNVIELPVEITQPKNKLSNEMGIKELIGRGTSNFAGSIPNRVFNVGLGTSRINGIIIPPDGIFSFNNTVGDITAGTGFKQAYVIKSGRTVLDDGGGICQVSTTLYRAVLNAGLPVVKRTAHAYRVGYYEQDSAPGLDATIYYPSVDFQFKNDTGHSILIQAYTSGLSMTVDFYGTDDGRIVNLTRPKIISQTPPLPEVRQDDPGLPKGTVKQVDYPAWGAKVVFSRTVTRNGETLINETINSNYRPWQAVYLVGTGG